MYVTHPHTHTHTHTQAHVRTLTRTHTPSSRRGKKKGSGVFQPDSTLQLVDPGRMLQCSAFNPEGRGVRSVLLSQEKPRTRRCWIQRQEG